MKILNLMGVVALVAAVTGCTQTTRSGGLASALATSSGGTVYENNQVVTSAQTAAQHPTVTNVLTAANTANGAPQTTAGKVTNALTATNIMAAVQSALEANAAKQAAKQASVTNGFGPGAAFGPGVFDTGSPLTGPAPVKITGYGN